jgi:serine protease Do
VKEYKLKGKWKEAGVKEGFIISFLDRVPVDDVDDFNRMLEYTSVAEF